MRNFFKTRLWAAEEEPGTETTETESGGQTGTGAPPCDENNPDWPDC